MEKIFEHKKLLIGCGCALLVIALVVLLAVYISNGAGDSPTLPSNGTTETTGPDTTVTTGPDATVPSSGTEPTEPDETTEPTTGPTVETYPTDPSTGEDVVPTEPSRPDDFTPAVDDKVDLGGTTPGTLTADTWNSWTQEQKTAFEKSYVYGELSLDDRFNLLIAQEFNGYDDGYEEFYFASEEAKQNYFTRMQQGCRYCGETDCKSFYGRGRRGETEIDHTLCPTYTEERDPTVYCQECGYKKLAKCEVGETGCAKTINSDAACYNCGEMRHVGQCHNCALRPKEDQYIYNK